jgi:hypothetical protein
MRWFVGTVAAAIVATIVGELWALIKAGALFDFIQHAAGPMREAHFIRTDLVSSEKQSVAQWILAISSIAGWIAVGLTRRKGEPFMDTWVFGIGYGFTFGLGILFFLAMFDRFKDIQLAVGDLQYSLAGIAMISSVAIAIAQRIRDRRES